MSRFLVDPAGKYLGEFIGWTDAALSARFPGGWTVAAVPPVDARQIWSGAAWSAPPAVVEEKTAAEKLADVLVAKGVLVAGDVAAVKGAR